MRKIFSSLMLLAGLTIVSTMVTAQNSFSYQAVIRDGGKVLENKSVSLRLSVMLADSVYYAETHSVTTNAYGNVSVNVGEGTQLKGSFAAVPWETMRVMMQVEVSTDGSDKYTNMGSLQIQPVPYTFYAPRTTTVIQPTEASDEPIFQVKDNAGNLMFAVYETGVKVFVDYDGDSKAAKSKFAVASVKKGKESSEDLLTIDKNGMLVYVDDNADGNKAAKSKFAVASIKRGKNKTDLLTIDGSGSTIYVDGEGKAAKSKFAVASVKRGKGKSNLMTVDASGSTIYIDDEDVDGKAAKSKFAVASVKKGKGDQDSQKENMFTIDGDGTTIYVDFNSTDKAAKSKFAVAGRSAKGGEVLDIDGDQATFYIDIDENENDGKAAKSKFAVAGRPASKDEPVPYFIIDQFGQTVYIDDDENGKAAKSKFAVASVKKGKGIDKFFTIERDSTRIYINDEVIDETGTYAFNFAIVNMLQNVDMLKVNRDSTIINMNTYTTEELQTATGTVERLYVTVKFADGANGKVIGYLDGKQLGDTCDVLRGTVIKLESQPDDNYSLLAWSDGSFEQEHYVTINSDTTFSAEFIRTFKFAKSDSAWISTKKVDGFDASYNNLISFSGVAVDTIKLDESQSVHYLLFDGNGNETDNEADAVAVALCANDTTFIARALKPFTGTVEFGLKKTNSDTVKIAVNLDSKGLWYNLPEGDENGTVTSTGNMSFGDTVTLTAQAKGGKVFGGWKVADMLQDTSMTLYNKQFEFPLIYDIIGTSIEPVFVDPVLYVAEAANPLNTGFSASEPLPSIDMAVLRIMLLQPEKLNWTIKVDGLVTGGQVIPGEIDLSDVTLEAEDYIDSILLTGINNAKLDGGYRREQLENDYNYTQQFSVLTVITKVPVTIENLEITGGNGVSMDIIMDSHDIPNVGCGVFVADYANVTLGEGVVVKENFNGSVIGGGVYVGNHSTLNISGAIIEENSGTDRSLMGGGVYVGSNSVLNMTDGYIRWHDAESGGGVYVAGNSIFNMTGGVIAENEAEYGGGVYVASTMYMSDSAVIGNLGAMLPATGESDGTSNEFSNLASYGGAIYANRASVYIGYRAPENAGEEPIEDDNFEGGISYNFSYSNGGGVYVDAGSVLKMHGGCICNNSAGNYGGGVYVDHDYNYEDLIAEFTMDGGIIRNNTAEDYGGAVYVSESTEFKMGGSAYIPAGVLVSTGGMFFDLETGPRMNDVYLDYNKVNIVSNLTGEKLVATLTFYDWSYYYLINYGEEVEAVSGLLVGDSGEKNYEKFAVTPYDGNNYLVNADGKLSDFYLVEFVYYDRVRGDKQTMLVRNVSRCDTVMYGDYINAPEAPTKSNTNTLSTTGAGLGWFVINDDGSLVEFDDKQPIENNTTIVYVWEETAKLNGGSATFKNAVENFLDPYCAYTINVKSVTVAQDISDNLISSGVHEGGLKFHSITLQSYNDEYTVGKQQIDAGWYNNNGTWKNRYNRTQQGPALTIDTRVPVTIKNLKITGGYNPSDPNDYSRGKGGGIYVGENAKVTIGEGTEITGNYAKNGAGVYIYSIGKVNVNDDIVCNGQLNMTGGDITGNYADNCGGGVYIYSNGNDSNGQLNMTGGNIADNNAASLGGGVCIFSGTFKMEGGTIKGNSGSQGNGVYTACSIELSDSAKIAPDNDIYMSSTNNSSIIIAGEWNNTDDTLAVLSFEVDTYKNPKQAVNAASGVQLSDYTDKFAVLPGIGASWRINNAGRLEITSPQGAIYTPYTVNAAGKKVYFGRSNIFRDAYAQNQYRYQFRESQYVSNWISTGADDYYSWDEGINLNTNYIYNFNGVLTSDQWRLPTKEEWEYLINRPGKCAQASIVSSVNTYKGLLLLPDDWSGDAINGNTYESNVFTIEEWEAMENKGAVFLEAGGYYGYTYPDNSGSVSGFGELSVEQPAGQYWSSTSAGDDAYLLSFKADTTPMVTTCAQSFELGLIANIAGIDRKRPVRFVQDIRDPNAFYVNPSSGNDDSNNGQSSATAFKTLNHAFSAIKDSADIRGVKGDYTIYINGSAEECSIKNDNCNNNVAKITIVGEGSESGIAANGVALTLNYNTEVTLLNLNNFSGVDVRQGTLNMSGCVINGCEWTAMNVSSGTVVNIENSTISNNDIDVTVSGGTLNLKSGACIYGKSYVDTGATFTVSGTAKAGTVNLAQGTKIAIVGELAEGKDTVATIVPVKYPVDGGNAVVVLEKTGGLSTDDVTRFAVVASGDGQEWEIGTNGALNKAAGGKASMKALNGEFTVSATGKKVKFSSGNLRYLASRNKWGFAEKQYDIVRDGNANISETNDGWIDLFGWATSGYEGKNPWMSSTTASDYYGATDIAQTDYDWGVKITNDYGTTEQWRTLTYDEWNYLLNNRPDKYGYAQINCGSGYSTHVRGLILLPDDFTLPDGVTFTSGFPSPTPTYTVQDWEKMEAAGAVFIPLAQYRMGNQVSDNGGNYWTSTKDADYANYAKNVWVSGSTCQINNKPIYYGNSVRLVCDSDGSGSTNQIYDWMTPDGAGHYYVDLGTGTLWATTNLGAESPEQPGQYFAWGETTARTENFNSANYQASDIDIDLTGETDAAYVMWGSRWSMPDTTEFKKLSEECYWEWTDNYNGTPGFIVYKTKSDSDKGVKRYSGTTPTTLYTYALSDEHIFLPAAGYYSGSDLFVEDQQGYYWSVSNLNTEGAKALFFTTSISDPEVAASVNDKFESYRYYGFSVRPVMRTYFAVRPDTKNRFNTIGKAVSAINNYNNRDGEYTIDVMDDLTTGFETSEPIVAKSVTIFSPGCDTIGPVSMNNNSETSVTLGPITITNQLSVNGSKSVVLQNARVVGSATSSGVNVASGQTFKMTLTSVISDFTKTNEYAMEVNGTLIMEYYSSFENNDSRDVKVNAGGRLIINHAATPGNVYLASGTTITIGSDGLYEDENILATIHPAVYPQEGGPAITVLDAEVSGTQLPTNKFKVADNPTDGSKWEIDTDGTLKKVGGGSTGQIYEWMKDDGYGHYYVDLGLPSGTLWATTNIGATNPQDFGDYIAWGERERKENYIWANYKYCSEADPITLTQYYSHTNYGDDPDNKIILDRGNDAASANWSGSWEMPTKSEGDELLHNCFCPWVENYNNTGVAGRIVYKAKNEDDKGKIGDEVETYSLSDPHIFLPAAGYIDGTDTITTDNVYHGLLGEYWCSAVLEGDGAAAYCLELQKEHTRVTVSDRYLGLPVRPVFNPDFVLVGGATIKTPISTEGSEFHYASSANPVEVSTFYMCAHEVTQAEYEQYCVYIDSLKPSQTQQKDKYPVYNISWYDAIVYCNLRSLAENKTPVYSVYKSDQVEKTIYPWEWDGIVKVGEGEEMNAKYRGPDVRTSSWDWVASSPGYDNITIDSAADGYRLPTVIEWEYAARGGHELKGTQYQYSGSDNLEDVTFNDGYIHEIKLKQPNDLGIYDMTSIVAELIFDVALEDWRVISPAKDPIISRSSVYPYERTGNGVLQGLRLVLQKP